MAVNKERLQEEEASFIRFCKIVLGWDYFRLLTEAAKQKKKSGKGVGSGLKQVKNTYKDVDDYLATFEPLLFEEVKAQIIQKKDDEEVTEWVMRLVVECNEAEGFLLTSVTYGDDEGQKMVQNDLLLLSEDQFKEGGGKLPQVYAFALVEQCQHNLLRLRMFLAGEVMNLNTDVIETRTRLLKMQALITSMGLLHEKRLFSLKICSLSTISREYFALRSIGSLPFKDFILTAADKSSSSEDQAWKVSKTLSEHLGGNLNKSQMEAIDAGLSHKAFILIQVMAGKLVGSGRQARSTVVWRGGLRSGGISRAAEKVMAGKLVGSGRQARSTMVWRGGLRSGGISRAAEKSPPRTGRHKLSSLFLVQFYMQLQQECTPKGVVSGMLLDLGYFGDEGCSNLRNSGIKGLGCMKLNAGQNYQFKKSTIIGHDHLHGGMVTIPGTRTCLKMVMMVFSNNTIVLYEHIIQLFYMR